MHIADVQQDPAVHAQFRTLRGAEILLALVLPAIVLAVISSRAHLEKSPAAPSVTAHITAGRRFIDALYSSNRGTVHYDQERAIKMISDAALARTISNFLQQRNSAARMHTAVRDTYIDWMNSRVKILEAAADHTTIAFDIRLVNDAEPAEVLDIALTLIASPRSERFPDGVGVKHMQIKHLMPIDRKS
jgi:hypothetical protein